MYDEQRKQMINTREKNIVTQKLKKSKVRTFTSKKKIWSNEMIEWINFKNKIKRKASNCKCMIDERTIKLFSGKRDITIYNFSFEHYDLNYKRLFYLGSKHKSHFKMVFFLNIKLIRIYCEVIKHMVWIGKFENWFGNMSKCFHRKIPLCKCNKIWMPISLVFSCSTF